MMATTISIPKELLSTKVSWADISDDEELIPIKTTPTVNQWGKPLVIKKELQDREPRWAIEERKRLEQKQEQEKRAKAFRKAQKESMSALKLASKIIKSDPSMKEDLSNKTIVCRSCKEEFVWTVREQLWFKQKGFSAPKTCKPCKVLFKECGRMPNHNRRKTLAL